MSSVALPTQGCPLNMLQDLTLVREPSGGPHATDQGPSAHVGQKELGPHCKNI